ncbi:alpha/beta fold hydrolase [Chelativorans intermedius]|uniref:Alpha/beta fold hydrolase n=1 Tax=Chelativorans intermedius TaxID=515947 RepID=A0ABV6D867_9HYPH|nr:alpha/beta hydrolase [Chelativorans intermedius]MCT8996848.1 alpha/beta hydrolase [Chelativorans intermedius]
MGWQTETTLETPTGAALRLYVHAPQGRPRAIVQINHGLAEHAGRYGRFARLLADCGLAAYAHDHRGHGHTRAPGAPMGSFGPEPAAENVLADVLAVHDRIAADHPGLPVILFGHSLGAIIALAFLRRHAGRLRAAALWNAPLASPLAARAARAVLGWERLRLGSDVPSRLMPRLTFRAWASAIPDAATPFDWLSRDAAEVAAYIADPLCGRDATVAMWRAVFDLNLLAVGGSLAATVRRDLPIQLVGGGGDPSTKGGATMRRLAARLAREGFSNLQTRIYGETRHESLNELNRNLIMEDFCAWAKGAAG